MMLLILSDTIYHGRRAVAEITPAESARAFAATTGASPALAAAVAAGAFGSATSARAVARRWGLLMVETSEARAKGLVQ